jgi:hypothetical protein
MGLVCGWPASSSSEFELICFLFCFVFVIYLFIYLFKRLFWLSGARRLPGVETNTAKKKCKLKRKGETGFGQYWWSS